MNLKCQLEIKLNHLIILTHYFQSRWRAILSFFSYWWISYQQWQMICYIHYLFLPHFKVLLAYNWFTMLWLISTVQQGDSIIHTHISILFPYRLSQNTGRVPCAIRQVPLDHPFQILQRASASPQTQALPPPSVPFGNHYICFLSLLFFFYWSIVYL